MIPQIAGLTEQGIKDYVENLLYQLSVSAFWYDIAKSKHGEFLKVQLEKELNFCKNQYSQINTESPTAINLLSFMQGVETFANRMCNLLKDCESKTNKIQEEIDSINKFVSSKQERTIGQTMLPSGYVKKEKRK